MLVTHQRDLIENVILTMRSGKSFRSSLGEASGDLQDGPLARVLRPWVNSLTIHQRPPQTPLWWSEMATELLAIDQQSHQALARLQNWRAGTKKQAQEPIKEAAQKCGSYFVTKRWLGGTLTNFQTVKTSIDRLKKIDQMREKGELEFFSKKERARIEKEWTRLNDHLEGIREMAKAPAVMFVVDLNKEHIAVAEAKRLGMAVVGIADSNSDPEMIDFPIPGNDDAIRSIKLFTNLVADAFLEGSKQYSERVRSQTNKADEGAEMEEKPQQQERQQRARPARSGQKEERAAPAVVKMTRGRKLVAAGTAEDVEIAMELEGGAPAEAVETPDETKTDDTAE